MAKKKYLWLVVASLGFLAVAEIARVYPSPANSIEGLKTAISKNALTEADRYVDRPSVLQSLADAVAKQGVTADQTRAMAIAETALRVASPEGLGMLLLNPSNPVVSGKDCSGLTQCSVTFSVAGEPAFSLKMKRVSDYFELRQRWAITGLAFPEGHVIEFQ